MIDIRPISIESVRNLCELYHGYGSAGGTATYAYGVFEGGQIIAAYAWQPPPPGASKSVCPEAPEGVLALSRMIAVPKSERKLKHVSKPLMIQMKKLIDRTRYPVLVTYSDEGQGHTGYVYKCSGWEKTSKRISKFYATQDGVRISIYQNGGRRDVSYLQSGTTVIQRWEHWICPKGSAKNWMISKGWEKVPIPGKVWSSGNQAYKYENNT